MNERIRELLLKAASDYNDANGVFIPDDFVEKFAELIVEECIREIGYKSIELLDIDFYPHYQERLKKHFGVEE